MDAKTKQEIITRLSERMGYELGYELGYTNDILQPANLAILQLIEDLLDKIEGE